MEVLFTLVTMFSYYDESFLQIQGHQQMTRQECETELYLLWDNKENNLPFGRSDKWDIIGGEAKLENGTIIIVNMDNTDAKMKFLCVPTGWGNS